MSSPTSPTKRKNNKYVDSVLRSDEFWEKLVEELPGSILSDADILNEMKDGHITINPYMSNALGSCSYEITLGENYYEASVSSVTSMDTNDIKFINPYDASTIHKYWGSPKIATTATHKNPYNLKESTQYIVVQPKSFILAHSDEYIGGSVHIAAKLYGLNLLANIGIDISTSWGEIGFINRWILQIYNRGNLPVVLQVGERIAQIVFLRSSQPNKIYNDKHYEELDIDDIRKDWNPISMLPMLKKSRSKDDKHKSRDSRHRSKDDEMNRANKHKDDKAEEANEISGTNKAKSNLLYNEDDSDKVENIESKRSEPKANTISTNNVSSKVDTISTNNVSSKVDTISTNNDDKNMAGKLLPMRRPLRSSIRVPHPTAT